MDFNIIEYKYTGGSIGNFQYHESSTDWEKICLGGVGRGKNEFIELRLITVLKKYRSQQFLYNLDKSQDSVV